MLRNLYNKFFNVDIITRLYASRLFTELGPSSKQRKVLVIGGGYGNEWKYFEEKGEDVSVLDIRNVKGPKKFYQQSITDITPFSNKEFDAVVIGIVLEYVIDDIRALQEIFRVLKDDGLLVIQISYYKDKTNFPVRIYSRKTIIDLLKYTKFEIEKISPWGAYGALLQNRLSRLFILIFHLFIEGLPFWLKVDIFFSTKFNFTRKIFNYESGDIVVAKKNYKLEFTHYDDT
jgi:SAM-dependent methyltransferase